MRCLTAKRRTLYNQYLLITYLTIYTLMMELQHAPTFLQTALSKEADAVSVSSWTMIEGEVPEFVVVSLVRKQTTLPS
jgi:hypothetical protein